MTPHPSDEARKTLNRTGGILAVGSLAIMGLITVGLIFVRIPKENESIMFALVGGVIGLVTTAFGFFFGSTQHSKAQSETIDTLSRAQNPQVIAKPGDTITQKTETQSETRID